MARLTPADLVQRRKVWLVMSELFLDCDVQSRHEYISRACSESPYAIEELTEILKCEVVPVCIANLLCVAGVWDGFDEDWLFACICEEVNRGTFKRNNVFRRIYYHYLYCEFIRDEWIIIAENIARLRK